MSSLGILKNYQTRKFGEFGVRRTAPEDFEAYSRIREEGWVVAHVDDSLGITESDIRDIFKDKEKLKDKYLSSFVNSHLVLTHNGEVIGISGIYEKEPNIFSGGIYLDSNYSGQGLGGILLQEIISKLPKGSFYQVEVAKNNHVSRKFFTKHGFKLSGEESEHEISNGKKFPTVFLEREI